MSIEAFAALRARLSDPFVDRAEVLAKHGMDERALASIEADFRARLSANDATASELSQAYAHVYSEAHAGRQAHEGEAAGQAAIADASTDATAPAVESPLAWAKAPPAITETAPAPKTAEVPSFLREAPATIEPASPPSPSYMAPGPGVPPPAPGEQTMELGLASPLKRALPFGPSTNPALPTPAAAAPAPPVPRPQPVAPAPRTSLDHYALLSAEIVIAGADPVARAAVFNRFGVADPDALTSEWRARFAADPALADRFRASYARHYAHLQKGPRGAR